MTNATIQYLATLKLPELKKLAMQNNLTVHHKTGEAKLRQMLADKMFADSLPKPTKAADAAPAEPKVDVFHAPDEVREMLAPISAVKPEFQVAFSEGDKVWHFKYRGAEDCGNMSLPMRQIKMCATAVARGAYVLQNKNAHFDQMNAVGKNAYTATVL